MPMPSGHRVNKSDPEYQRKKKEREARSSNKKKNTSKSKPASSADLPKSQVGSSFIDPLEEERLADPDFLHINKDSEENQAIISRWALNVVPYFIIFVILFNIKPYLLKHYPPLASQLSLFPGYINKSNVGAVRIIVFLYASSHPELFYDVDLQFYVNQAQRHAKKFYAINSFLPESAFMEGVTHGDPTNTELLYNGKLIYSFDLFNQISAFFSKSDNLKLFGEVYAEFVGQNRINNCYSAIQANFAWALDLSHFSFPNFSFSLFIALDLASRRIMHYDFFTDNKPPTARALYDSIVNAFNQNGVQPDILHTDQASYFFGDFENELRSNYKNIRLSKTRLNLPISKNKAHQNQAVEAFFSSFKKWLLKKYGDDFFSKSDNMANTINLIRAGLKEVNADKEHRVLLNTPNKDYFNKIILDIIRRADSTENSDSFSNLQADQMVQSTPVLETEVISPEQAANLDMNTNNPDVIFLSQDGDLYDQVNLSTKNTASPPSQSSKIRKLIKSDIKISSSIIIEQFDQPDTFNNIFKIALKQLPSDFFEAKFERENDIIFNDTVYNAFFYSIKESLFSGPGSSAPLTEYLQDKLPNLIRGPGKIFKYNQDYLKFLDIQENLDNIIQIVLFFFNRFVVRLQFLVLTRQSEAQTLRQIEEHKKTQSMIADNHNKTLSEFQTVKDQLASVSAELNERKEREQAALEAKERRKQARRLPVREGITQEEYFKLNEFCNNTTLTDSSYETKYKASFLKISFFLLQATGMRVSNLFEVRLRDIDQLISSSGSSVIKIPLIKSSERKFVHVAIDAYIRRNCLFNDPYNISAAFEIIQKHCVSWLSLQNRSQDEYLDFPLANTFKKPDSPMSREYLTKSLNFVIGAINVDKFNKPLSTQPKTSHSFRVSVIDKITSEYGIEAARDFVNHSDIQTTDKYIRSRLTDQKRRQITSSLFTANKKETKTKSVSPEVESESTDSPQEN